MALSDGLYDLLLTEGLARSLAALDPGSAEAVSYIHLRAHETVLDLVCRLLLENKNTSGRASLLVRYRLCILQDNATHTL